MKENEDYLDDLLKTLGEEEKASFDDGGNFDPSELMDNAWAGNENMSGNKEEIKRPLSTLEKLMAEMESESEDSDVSLFGDDNLFSEASIGSLLENAKNTNDVSFGDNISYEAPEDIDMSEIETLLNMSDNNEIVSEDEAFLRALNGMDQESDTYVESDYPEAEGEVLELDPAELDALLSSDQGEMEEKGNHSLGTTDEIKSTDELSDSNSSDKKKKKKKEKKEGSGVFKKIFSLLMEEYPEDEEPKETGSLNLSE